MKTWTASMYDDCVDVPLASAEGLLRFYRESTAPPPKLSIDQYMAMSEIERRLHDERRLRFIHRNINVATEAYFETSRTLDFLVRQNRLTRHDKNFLGITGEPYMGKSHLLFTLAKATARRMGHDIPNWQALGYTPAVVITVPSPTTTKGILREIAAFFGYSREIRGTEDQLRRQLVDLMRESRTRVLAFDEAQNMAQGSRTLEDAKNLLRKLSQELSVTQIYSGTDLRASGLFEDISGRQLSERIRLLELRPYVISGIESREAWDQTLDAYEEALTLIGHEPGTLRKMDELLLYLTDGMLGELSNLLNYAATMLIDIRAAERFGSEQISELLIQAVPPSEAMRVRNMRRANER